MVSRIHCNDLGNKDFPKNLNTDLCSIVNLKWQLIRLLCGVLISIGIYIIYKWRYRCNKTLLTFHNIRAAISLMLFVLSTLEFAGALLPWQLPATPTLASTSASASASASRIMTNEPYNNSSGISTGYAGSESNYTITSGTSTRATQDKFVVIGVATYGSAFGILLAVLLMWYHRMVELKKATEFLYVSLCVEALIFFVRMLELAELVYDQSIFELMPLLQFLSSCCLLSLAVIDVTTIYKEGYRPDFLEDYEKIGYKHSLSTFYSKSCFWWLTPLLWFGYNEPLELEDLGQMRIEDSARAHYDRFLLIYKTALVKNGDRPPSLWLCYVKSSWRMFALGGILKLFGDLFALIGPLAIQQIVQYIEVMYGLHYAALGQLYGRNQSESNVDHNDSSIILRGLRNLNEYMGENKPLMNDDNRSERVRSYRSHGYSTSTSSYGSINGSDSDVSGGNIVQHILAAATGSIWLSHSDGTNGSGNTSSSISNRLGAADSLLLTNGGGSGDWNDDNSIGNADVRIYYPTWLDLLSNGWAIAWIVLVAALAQGALSQASTHILNMTGIRIKTSLQGLIYRKTLLLNTSCIDKQNGDGDGDWVGGGDNDDNDDGGGNATKAQTHDKRRAGVEDKGNLIENDRTENESETEKVGNGGGGSGDGGGGDGERITVSDVESNCNAKRTNNEKIQRKDNNNDSGSNDIGAITNLMSEDTLNIMSFFWIAHYVWAIPLKIAVVMYLLYLKLGISAVIGSFVCILTMTPLQFWIGKAMSTNTETMARFTDERLKRIHDMLVGIKIIKLNAWDEVFIKKITAARQQELKYLNKDSVYWTLMTILTHISSVLITFVTLAVYVWLNSSGDSSASTEPSIDTTEFTASRLFSALALFQQLTVPLLIFPITVPIIISAVVSTRRLERFLRAREIQKQFEGIRNMARILSKSDASLDMYEVKNKSSSLPANVGAKLLQMTEDQSIVQSQNRLNERLALKIHVSNKPAPLAHSEPHTPLQAPDVNSLWPTRMERPLVGLGSPMSTSTSDSSEQLLVSRQHEKRMSMQRKELLRNTPYVVIRPRKNPCASGGGGGGGAVQQVKNFERDSLHRDSLHRDSLLLRMPDNVAVSIKEACFVWNPQRAEQAALRIPDVSIPKERLTIIVGKNGSGKTSLLSALLMEMPLIAGNVIWNKTSTIAFVPQQPWLLNASIRENILFGESFRPKRYDFVLEACALKPDIDLMPESDLTVIGERGINLSGGQRQRVTIARALYSSANVVIMDDPLSSLDNEVARHIFEQAIKKMLLTARRTVIMVTQQLQLVQQADYLIVMKNGSLQASGSYKDIEKNYPHIQSKWNTIIARANEKEQQNLNGRTARERWKLFKNVSKLGLQRSISLITPGSEASHTLADGSIVSGGVIGGDHAGAVDQNVAGVGDDDEDDNGLSMTFSGMHSSMCRPQSQFGHNYSFKRSRSSVYGSRHLIYDVPLPIDECQTEDVILRRRRTSHRRRPSSTRVSAASAASGTSSRFSGISNTSSSYTEFRRSLLTASCSSATSNATDNSNNIANNNNNINGNGNNGNDSVRTPEQHVAAAVAISQYQQQKRRGHQRVRSWQPQSVSTSARADGNASGSDGERLLLHPPVMRNISSPGSFLRPKPMEQQAAEESEPEPEPTDAALVADLVHSTRGDGGFQQFLRRMSMRRFNKPSPVTVVHRKHGSTVSAANSILSITEETPPASPSAITSTSTSAQAPARGLMTTSADNATPSSSQPTIELSAIVSQSGSEADSCIARLEDEESVMDANVDYEPLTENGNSPLVVQQKLSNATSTTVTDRGAQARARASSADVERKYGKIPAQIYFLYLRSSGLTIVFVFFITALIWQCLRVYTDVWLQHWTDNALASATTTATVHHDVTYYFNVYALISCICIVMAAISTPAGQIAGCNARRCLHDKLLQTIMRKSLHFFRITPLGRIMNRFSNDMTIIDKKIAATSQRLLQFTLLCLCAVLINVSITWWFILLTLPICVAYYAIQKFYRCSSRELQRIENSTNSPVISHLSETIQGVTTIRAYNQEARFTEILFKRLEAHTIAFTILNTSHRWLGISLDYLGGVIVFVAIVTALLVATIGCSQYTQKIPTGDGSGSPTHADMANNMNSLPSSPATPQQSVVSFYPTPSLVGLAINYTLLVPIYLNWVVKLLADMEMYIGSVERIAYYAESDEIRTTTTMESDEDTDDEEVVAAVNGAHLTDVMGQRKIVSNDGNANDDDDHDNDDDGYNNKCNKDDDEVIFGGDGSGEGGVKVAEQVESLAAATNAVEVESATIEETSEVATVTTNTTAVMERNNAERRASECKRRASAAGGGKRYKTVPISWPKRGDISYENVSLKYEGCREHVIENLTLHVPAGQRLGICGRTGSGKSSLALSLFGVLQTSAGRICIDDVDISQIHPDEIRTRLSIIPQDVHLFNATIRENLDPPGYYSDLELWNCLELAQLKEFVNGQMPLGLDTEIVDGGHNLSAGHRQLFCLARAILRGSVCLVLDEATSCLDSSTERSLLAAAHKAFRGRTILTVAHRLSTILDYDRIIVLENGKIVEDGHPHELRENTNGVFYSLLQCGKSTGDGSKTAEGLPKSS